MGAFLAPIYVLRKKISVLQNNIKSNLLKKTKDSKTLGEAYK